MLGQVSEFEAIPGKGIKCKVSGLENVPALNQQSQEAPSDSSRNSLSGIILWVCVVIWHAQWALLCVVSGSHEVLVGSRKLMMDNNIVIPANFEDTLIELEGDAQTAIIVAIDGV